MSRLSSRLPITVILAILLISTNATSAPRGPETQQPAADIVSRDSASTNESRGEIAISSNSDLALQASAEGWPGNGTASSPYVIEDYIISDSYGAVRIENVDMHFIIRNCTLEVSGGWRLAVMFNHVSNGRIESSEIIGGVGVGLIDCIDCILENNTFVSEHEDLYLIESQSCEFLDNRFSGRGVQLFAMSEYEVDHAFTNNLLDGKKVGYFYNIADTEIVAEDYSQVFLASCNNVTVTNGDFLSVISGVMFAFSSSCRVTASRFYDASVPIDLAYSDDIEVDSNIIQMAEWTGILLNSSDGSYIHDNQIYNGGHSGIEMSDSFVTTIENNTIRFGYHGIYALDGSVCYITNNIIYNTTYSGIALQRYTSNYTVYGNKFLAATRDHANDEGLGNWWDDTVSIGNYWDDYGGAGAYNIPGSAGSVDHYPMVLTDNTAPILGSPLDLEYEEGAEAQFIDWPAYDDYPGFFSVKKDGYSYMWAWWNGSDSEISVPVSGLYVGVYNFTITVYDVEGNFAKDWVLVNVTPDSQPPVITPADDLAYEDGSTGNEIVWTAYDANPYYYTVLRNGTLCESNNWTSIFQEIVIDVDGLDVGLHNFTIIFSDKYMSNSTDQVNVTVTPDTTPPVIWGPIDFLYEENRTGSSITWTAYDSNPLNYTIVKNGMRIAEGDWNSSTEEFYVYTGGQMVGVYNYTLILFDEGLRSMNDTVRVDVVPDTYSPEVNHPADITYRLTQTGNTILWYPSDPNPSSYSVYFEGLLNITGTWNSTGEVIEVNVDGLEIGVYSYDLFVNDTNGNTANDTVVVTVLEQAVEPHGRIAIFSDDDFEYYAQLEGWPGDGSESNPFRIEWYDIVDYGTCITIQNTAYHFIIRNCTLRTPATNTIGGTGVNLYYAHNGVIEYCLLDMKYEGMDISYSGNLDISECVFSSCQLGVMITYSSNVTVSDSNFEGMEIISIAIQASPNCSLDSNSLSGGGLFLYGESLSDYDIDVNNNTVNGKSLGYFYDLAGAEISGSDYGQIIVAGCSDSLLAGISISGTYVAITIAFSDDMLVLSSTLQSNFVGLWCKSSSYVSIHHSEFSDSQQAGIMLEASELIDIQNCEIANCSTGIYFYSASDSLIDSCVISNGNYGIQIWGGSDSSIINNVISNNTYCGIYIYSGSRNSIYGNVFDNYGINASDGGSDNTWDDGIRHGNYWSSYTPPGEYFIPGSAGSVDRYPFSLNPIPPPSIDQPGNLYLLAGTFGNKITWQPLSDHPDHFEVRRNGTLVWSGIWNGDEISVDVDYLVPGVYNFTLTVWDAYGGSASDSVLVYISESNTSVTDGDWGPIITAISVTAIIGSLGVAVVIIVLIIRSRMEGTITN